MHLSLTLDHLEQLALIELAFFHHWVLASNNDGPRMSCCLPGNNLMMLISVFGIKCSFYRDGPLPLKYYQSWECLLFGNCCTNTQKTKVFNHGLWSSCCFSDSTAIFGNYERKSPQKFNLLFIEDVIVGHFDGVFTLHWYVSRMPRQ